MNEKMPTVPMETEEYVPDSPGHRRVPILERGKYSEAIERAFYDAETAVASIETKLNSFKSFLSDEQITQIEESPQYRDMMLRGRSVVADMAVREQGVNPEAGSVFEFDDGYRTEMDRIRRYLEDPEHREKDILDYLKDVEARMDWKRKGIEEVSEVFLKHP